MNRNSILFAVFLLLNVKSSVCQDSISNPGWEQLKIETKNSSIIGLGEESHGMETFNQMKADIVRFLLKQGTIRSIVFESSFVACMTNYLNKNSFDNRIKGSLYPFWNTTSVQTVLKLFYQDEQNSGKPLIVGCDIQEDCRYEAFSNYLVTNKIIPASQARLLYCDSILSVFIGKNFSRQRLTEKEYDELLHNYQFVFAELDNRKNELGPHFELISRCLENRKWLCRYLTIKDVNQRMFYRDSLMAANILWLKQQVYRDQPFVVWAANTHLGKRVENARPRWMGEWLSPENYYCVSVGKKGLFSSTKKALGGNSFITFTGKERHKFDAIITCGSVRKIKPQEWITPCE